MQAAYANSFSYSFILSTDGDTAYRITSRETENAASVRTRRWFQKYGYHNVTAFNRAFTLLARHYAHAAINIVSF